jgi:hypothetical protein
MPVNGVDRTDVHGLGTQSFLFRTVWLLVNIIQSAFMVGPKISGGYRRADATTDTPLVDMIPGWTVVCQNTHIHWLGR